MEKEWVVAMQNFERARIGLMVFLILFSAGLAFAHITPQEAQQAKALIDSKTPCSELSGEQLELLGEYYMEQAHPGEAHEAMHSMMGLQEGSVEEEQFHVNMARNSYCGNGTSSSMMDPRI